MDVIARSPFCDGEAADAESAYTQVKLELLDCYGKRQFEEALLKLGWEKVPEWECMFVHRNEGLFLSVYVDDTKMAGKKQNMVLICNNDEKCHYWRTHIIFLDFAYLGCTQRECKANETIIKQR